MTTTPPPPPPPWDDAAPPGSPQAESASPDPTPILSAIGQINIGSNWGNEQARLTRLQGIAVAWNFQWFAVAAIAAAIPWALGRTGVLWSALLMATEFAGGFMQSRFARKHGVVVKVAVTQANRRQALIRMVLWQSLVVAWLLGIVVAFDSSMLPTFAVTIAVTLAVVTAVLIRKSRQHAATQPSAPQDLSPPNDDGGRG